MGPVASGRIGIEIKPGEAVVADAWFDLADAVLRRDAGRLRQHADADEVAREERADAVDQLIAGQGPGFAGRRVAQMMAHSRCARREDGKIGAALALHLELSVDDGLPDFVVRHRWPRRRNLVRGMRLNLLLAPFFVLRRRRGVVTMTIDNHKSIL